MDLTIIQMPDFLIISATTLAADVTAALITVGLAFQLRRLARSARGMLILNRSLATILVSVGGWMALG
jgi:threonine/homoserine/homoserine lactone efflux protein